MPEDSLSEVRMVWVVDLRKRIDLTEPIVVGIFGCEFQPVILIYLYSYYLPHSLRNTNN